MNFVNLYLHLVNDNWAYWILYDFCILTIYQEVSLSIYLVNDNWAACAAYLDPPTVQRDILLHHLSINSRTLITLVVRCWKWFGHIPNNEKNNPKTLTIFLIWSFNVDPSTNAARCAHGSSVTSWLALSWFRDAPGRKLELVTHM